MRLEELEELEEYFEPDGCTLFDEEVNEYCLWVEDKSIFIKDYGINVKFGIFENWNCNTKEYEVSHRNYMIFDEASGEYLGCENSELTTCIFNFLSSVEGLSLSHEEILELECEFK